MTSTFYPPFHIGGDAVHVRYLAEELVRRGHEVHVLYSVDAYRLKRGGTLPYEDQIGVQMHPVEAPTGRVSPAATFMTGSNRRAERLLEQLVVKERADWVHHHNISLLGARLLSVGKTPKFYTAHDYWLVCQRSDLLYMGRAECEDRRCLRCSMRSIRPLQIWRSGTFRRAISSIDLLIAPSAFMASTLKQNLGVEVEVIPNFAPRALSVRSSSGSGPHFLFASVLERNKGLDLLLDAYRIGDISTELHIAGRGPLENLVRQRERESDGKIRYLGFIGRDDLIPEIESAVALVLPSRYLENSPLSCIEALALGTPIVVSGRGGLPELVEDPQSGLVCGSSAGEISEVLQRMERDSGLRSLLSKNALERYERNHSPERYVDEYMKRAEAILAS